MNKGPVISTLSQQAIKTPMANAVYSLFLVTRDPARVKQVKERLDPEQFCFQYPDSFDNPFPGKKQVNQDRQLVLFDLVVEPGEKSNWISTVRKLNPGAVLVALVDPGDLAAARRLLNERVDDVIFEDQLSTDSLSTALKLAFNRYTLPKEAVTPDPFPNLLQNLPGMAYRCYNTPSWPMLKISRGAEKLTGYPREKLLAGGELDYGDLIHSQDQERVWTAVQQAVKGGQKFSIQYRIITRQGVLKWVQEEGRAYVDPSENVEIIEGYIADITSRVMAELAQQSSRERYSRLFESIPIGLYRTDQRGKLTDVNLRLVELLGYPDRESLLGVDVSDLYVDSADEQEWRDWIQEDGVVEKHEIQLFRHDGTRIWVQDNSQAVQDASGQVTAYQGSLEDVTDQVKTRQALQQRNRQLEALQKVSVELSSELDLNQLLLEILHSALDLVQGSSGGINIYHPEREALILDVHSGHESLPVDTAVEKGEGVIGRVWDRQEIVRVDDYQQWEHALPDWQEHYGRQAVLGIPIIWGENFLGVLELLRESGRPFQQEDLDILELFAVQAAVAIHNAQVFNRAQQRLSRLRSLREIDRTISSSLDMELTLNVLARRLMDTLQADAAAVHRFDPALQTIQHVASVGFRTARIRETNQQIAVGQAGQAAYQRQPIYYPDLNSEPVEFARAGLIQDENFQAYFAVPLLSKGEIMGVMEVFLRSPLEPEEEWIQFLETMAGQAALAIDHLNLFQDLQRSNLQLTQAYHQVIEGWARALELKDKETEGHSRRVVRLTLAVAEKLGLRKEQLADLRQGALLHDIGKMGIPDRIIQKPGPLDDSEWELMKKHPLFAYEMLKPISHLEGAVEIPYSHHERWDGSGYPQGLQGEEIPLSARIFAVVDVWDALLSDRPYRKAWSEDKAVTYIKEQSGKQFDPRVVSALMEMINQDHPALNR